MEKVCLDVDLIMTLTMDKAVLRLAVAMLCNICLTLTKAEVISAHDAHFNCISQLGVIQEQLEVAGAHWSQLAKDQVLAHPLHSKTIP